MYAIHTEGNVAVAGDSCSRIFVTVVNLCAFVNGQQHLFFLVRVLDGDFFLFFFCRGRSGDTYFERDPYYSWRRQN